MHRRIDTFVDAHPATARSIALLPASHRRYGGIMLDVLHDHFLATEWQAWSSIDLPDFARQIYTELATNEPDLPESFRMRMPRMIANHWLESFTDFEVVDRVLRHISTRLRRENPLIDGAAVLVPHLEELRKEFQILFPGTLFHARQLSPNAVWAAKP